MSKLSYKSLLIIFCFLLIGVIVLAKFVLPKQVIKATWWNDGWHYRQAINITSHTSSESNVFITTTINIGSTTKAQIDDGDFRFISQSGENLSYYIVSGAGTTNVSFHILIPSFPSNTSTIYAYYGNSTIENGFSAADFSTVASNYTIGSLSTEEVGGGPIAYWKFDEGVGTTAYDSAGSSNGTFSTGSSAPTWADESQCISGKCLHFNGVSTAINGGNNQSLNLNTAITVQSWVKFDQLDYSNNTGTLQYLIKKGYPDTLPSNFGWWFAYDNRSNRNSFSYTCFGNSAGGYSGGGNNFSSNPKTFSNEVWYLLSFTVTSTEAKLYINGTQFGSTKNVSNLQLSDVTNNLYIGNNLKGYMDETKIYPYARTPDQIKQDYNSRGSSSGSSVNLGVQSSTAPDLNSSLVAYYKFDEGNGSISYDSSVNNKNGTLAIGSSSPTWDTNGHLNKALNFDGNDSIRLANEIVSTSSIRVNGITYSAWIKPNNISGIQKIVGQKPSSGYSDLASGGLDISSGKARMIAYDDNVAYKYATGNTTLIPNRWYFITGIYNPLDKKIKIYVNGKFDGGETSITTFNRLISNDYNLIGSHNFTSNFFNGLIDELKIYNYALTDDEIKQDYNQGSAISFGSSTQTIGGTTTSLEYCIPGDTTYCAPPVAEWKMDEGVGTSIVDTSGNSNTGTISGATWSQGKIGKSLSFNGSSDHVNIGTLNSQNTFTLSAWIKANLSSNSDYRTILDKNISLNDRNFWFALENTTSKLSLRFSIGNNGNTFIADTPLNDDKWHYVTATYDNSYVKLYVDGKIDMTPVAITGIPDSATTTSYISRQGSGRYFFGSIDHVKIYNYARTPAQVAWDYNKGAPIGWWKLDECQGNTAYDWSENNNNGTINIGSGGSQNSLGTCQIGTSAAWTNGATGKINSSLNFGGIDDYINVGTNSIFNITGDLSLSAWVKPTSNSGCFGIIDKSSGGSGSNAPYLFWRCSQTFNFYRGNGSNYDSLITSKNYPANNWYHLTIVSGTNNKIYINGILDNTANKNYTYTGNSNPLLIGAMSTTPTLPFQGQIDDVRIYNYALTSEQVKMLYNGGAVSFN